MIWWILIIYCGFIHAGLIVLRRHCSSLYFIFLILFRTTNQDRKWSLLERGRARRLVEAHFIIKLHNYRVYKFNVIGGLEPEGNSVAMWAPDSSFVALFSVITTIVSHSYRTPIITLGTIHIKLVYFSNLSEASHQNKSTDLRSEHSSKVHLSIRNHCIKRIFLQIRERTSCLLFF